ncbi:hypothetical protein CFC21_085012 [Triticum aestivum]|uniref:Uncharacterized protein n=3 Tax=Triticum TaxID=4564 RepID=A0A9R0Y9M8_TRITD|nr:hypothetical protein CFC21_085012 [Triticum aestivum]VAI50738.1 unnamed protein product [Triticum turgidum subsp. durum]
MALLLQLLKNALRHQLDPQVLLPKIHPFSSLVQSGLLIPSRDFDRFGSIYNMLDRAITWLPSTLIFWS